jgi:glycosyltransferase involved in cell wall biosynthesis
MSDEKIRVAVVADSMLNLAGGSGSYMHYLVRSLLRNRPADIELTFAFTHPPPPSAPLDGSDRLVLSRYPLVADRRLSRFDVILLNLMLPRSPVFFNRPKVVTVIHGGYEIVSRRPLGAFLFKKFARPILLLRSSVNVTVSEASSRLLESLWPHSRFRVIYNGVDHEVFRPSPHPQPFEVNGETLRPGRYIFHISRFMERKNPSGLFRIFREFKERRPSGELRLVIGGKGWEPAIKEQQASYPSLADDIRYLGFIEERDLPRIYSNALAMVFLSTYEGFGLPVAEAMACGCPVVANRAFALEEVALDEGLFDLERPSEWSRAVDYLSRLLDDSAYRVRACDLATRRAADFCWDRTARSFYEIFRSLARGG